jgi:hypothetical protein
VRRRWKRKSCLCELTTCTCTKVSLGFPPPLFLFNLRMDNLRFVTLYYKQQGLLAVCLLFLVFRRPHFLPAVQVYVIFQNLISRNYASELLKITEVKLHKKFWEELIAYFPLIQHEKHRKRCLEHFFVSGETSLPCNDRRIHRQTHSFSFIRHGSHRKRLVQQFFCFWRELTPAGACIPNHRLATTWKINIQTQTDGRELWNTPLRRDQVP